MRWYFGWALLCASAIQAGGAPAGVEKLLPYKGTWKIETEEFNTKFSKAGKDSSTLKNDCWLSGDYFVCNQYVNGKSKNLIVFTYDAKSDSYNSFAMLTAGGPGGKGKLLIKDNVWTFPWERKDSGKTYHFHVINKFTAPGTIEYRQEFSEDQVTWTVTAKGLEHKLDKAR